MSMLSKKNTRVCIQYVCLPYPPFESSCVVFLRFDGRSSHLGTKYFWNADIRFYNSSWWPLVLLENLFFSLGKDFIVTYDHRLEDRSKRNFTTQETMLTYRRPPFARMLLAKETNHIEMETSSQRAFCLISIPLSTPTVNFPF